MPGAADKSTQRRPLAPRLPPRHRWMLLLAFEMLVFGFTQAMLQPVRTPGVTVEQVLTPNHVVT